MIEEDSHIDNVYALDENAKEIYIGDVTYADRGIRKNYFCLGCKRRMQAVKPLTKRQEHFRHHVKPNSTEVKCVYRDETYRHFLAKANALDLKRIKVPAVYKYSTLKNDDKAFLIKDAEFIEATTVLNEHFIYENEDGEISIAEKIEEKGDKYLFMKPDSIFLDKEGKPILIIEFVATHKPDQEKLMKLKRLGIDAIQVSIPKSSPEEIQNLFFKTTRTKWLYNHAENQTDYLQLSNSYSGGISEIDNEQRRLLEEGYLCRKAQLGDFIRTLTRFVESQHYKEVEQHLESEIRRVEENSDREESELEDLRTSYIESGIAPYNSRREQLEREEREFQLYCAELEGRYNSKKRAIELEESAIAIEESAIDDSIKTIEFAQTGGWNSGDSIEQAIEREKDSFRILGERINFERTREESEIGNVIRSIEAERAIIESIPNETERAGKSIEERVRAEEGIIENEIRGIKSNIDNAPARLETDILRINKELEDGHSNGSEWYLTELSKLDTFRESLILYKSAVESCERFEQKERDNNEKK